MNDAIVAEVLQTLRSIDVEQKELTKLVNNHVKLEDKDRVTIIQRLDALTGAFPDGDIIGHHSYHHSLIKRNEWITQLCKDMVKEIAKYGLLGFLGWLGYQAWIGFLAGPK